MSGAASFVLGLLGLGASAGINASQSIKQKKADYQYGEECGLHGTPDVLRMRECVRKEWWDVLTISAQATRQIDSVYFYSPVTSSASDFQSFSHTKIPQL